MSILTWVIFGIVVGLIANFIDPKPKEGGVIGVIILGILGAIIGGFLGNLIFGVGISGFAVQSLIVAVLGASLLMSIGKMINQT